MALRHGPACALVALVALMFQAGSSTASVRGALVRQVRALSSPQATRIVVDVEGAFTHETTVSRDGRSVVVRIDGAALAEQASRVVPVADPRVDGVLVTTPAAGAGVSIAIDIAGRTAPVVRTEVVDAGLTVTLTTARAARDPAGTAGPGRPEAKTPGASAATATPHRDRGTAAKAGPRRDTVAATTAPRRETGAAAMATRPTGSRATAPAGLPEPASSSRVARSAAASADTPRPGAPRLRSVVERFVVILDPGHGGRDPGATAWTGELEKDIVLDLASRVARRLRERGDIDVVLTRTGDEYVSLEDRRDASSRWGADAFVSLHANASPSAAARGIETYYHADSADRAVRRLAKAENEGRVSRRTGATASRAAAASSLPDPADSARLAEAVQTQLVRHLGMRYEAVRDLGAKEGPFFVIGGNAAPSVLVEAAFLTHREEGLRMGSQVYRERIAEGVARGILGFLDGRAGPGAY